MAKKRTSPAIITTSKDDLRAKCVRITGSYYNRAWQARWNRRSQNLANWNAYHSRMDWSGKLPWQTQQTVSEFGMAIEQSVGILERGLTDTEDWLTVEPVAIGKPVIDPDTIAHLLKYYLQRLWIPGNAADTAYSFANLVSDGVKRGLLESIITAKVYGVFATKYQYKLVSSGPKDNKYGRPNDIKEYQMTSTDRPKVARDTIEDFRLAVDLIPWEDFFPDPSLLNTYVIHEVSAHLSELAANPDYDPKVIDAIRGTANSSSYADMYKRITQDVVFVQHPPDEVRVQECWGDLIDPTSGEVLATNSFWTICNGLVLRPPTPNPFWHGKLPFVSAALLRTPNSTVHKALADDAVDAWRFLNELISLMFDGALGSVWGKYQMRTDFVENSEDYSEGVPQASTILLRPNTPEGYKALERIDETALPQYAMEMFNLGMREFQTAMATNDLRLGQQPPREATATSIVEAMSASGSLFESIAARVEDSVLEPIFELGWMTILQYEFDHKLTDPALVQILGPERVLELTKLSNEERFVLLAQSAKFKCRGLRGVAARNRTMTKLANYMQLMGQVPQLAASFDRKYSWDRMNEQLLRGSGADPSTLEKTQEEKDAAEAQSMVNDALNAAQVTQPGAAGPEGATPPAVGGSNETQANGGSPPALTDASQNQMGLEQLLAPKTPGGQIPGAPQPGMGGGA